MPQGDALVRLVYPANKKGPYPVATDIEPLRSGEVVQAIAQSECVQHTTARNAFTAIACLYRVLRRRMAEAKELQAMSDRDLRDFGISRYDAHHTLKKAFWKF